jgi:ubiquinone/menaquinone biosynthesis C-methylase UbiE
MNVVDLCCGDGWFTFPLSKIARRVIAIDIDRNLLDAAKIRFRARWAVAQSATFRRRGL